MFPIDNSSDLVINGYDGLANNTKSNEYILGYVTSDSCEIQLELHMKTVTTKDVVLSNRKFILQSERVIE